MAGLTEIPVIVKELDDSKAAQVALIENIQREDLNPIEESGGVQVINGRILHDAGGGCKAGRKEP